MANKYDRMVLSMKVNDKMAKLMVKENFIILMEIFMKVL